MGASAMDLRRQQFGKLRVIARAPREDGKQNGAYWACKCDCGNQLVVPASSLRSGVRKSCGCLKRERLGASLRTHGGSRTREFHIWSDMRARCHRPTHASYPEYGGRGIIVCDRWRVGENGQPAFACFIADMGQRPDASMSIDRIDNNGNYEPGNCRWATSSEQQSNTRRTVRIVYEGVNMALADAIRAAGNVVKWDVARQRIRRGWDVERAVKTRVG